MVWHKHLDDSLKPKLLRESHSPSELMYIVSSIKTHKLHSEWTPKSTDKKLIDEWKSVVDHWDNRLLTLTSSNMVNHLQNRVFTYYKIQIRTRNVLGMSIGYFSVPELSGTDSHFVRVASYASIAALLIRLSGFPNPKKDGTSQATKLIKPVLKLLYEDSSDVFWVLSSVGIFWWIKCSRSVASALLVFRSFCGSISGVSLRGTFSHLLLQIIRSRRRSGTSFLDYTLSPPTQNHLKNYPKTTQIHPEKETPQTTNSSLSVAHSTKSHRERRKQVPIDGGEARRQESWGQSEYSGIVHFKVPKKALAALQVVQVESQRDQFLIKIRPEFETVRANLLNRTPIPSLDMIVSAFTTLGFQGNKNLLTSPCLVDSAASNHMTGSTKALHDIRVVTHLSQEVVTNAFIDLESFGDDKKGTSFCVHANASMDTSSQPRRRKRKLFEVAMPQNPDELALKVAALEALETLLTVGGSLRSKSWRAKVDDLLITVATNACKGGLAKEKTNIFGDERTPLWADFQLASLRALLASFLSPGHDHAPYLSLGLELFRRGMLETGSSLAEYCKHGLLTLQVLIHPRALPLVDFSSTIDNYEGQLEKDNVEPEVNDDLYKNWLENDDEMEEVLDTESQRNTNYTAEHSAAVRYPSPVKLPNESESGLSTSVATESIPVDRDNVMVELQETNGTGGDQLGEHVLSRVAGDYPKGHTSGIVSKTDSLDPINKMTQVSNDTAMKSDAVIIAVHEENAEKNVSGTKDGGFSTLTERISSTLISNLEKKSKGLTGESDEELSMDSLPDIIDVKPYSD
ncbi:Hypothetical predicted protein [Olea europaea subsp. europaea]|uniref:Uncharacterized protein n=1 Tax=Olea europaea subsp. europaea TaxID=158383 RepID=A0A8S0RCB2_OLEEU|nr:Hypothetical predicted protein [Olea europaea subsp. europaea]